MKTILIPRWSNLQKRQKGFTLLELLLASFMTFFVVSATGWGLFVMLREQTASTAGSDVTQNTNRALDFITDEVKSASSILDSTTLASASGGCNASGYTPILGITISGQPSPIIYCINSTAYTPSSTVPWLGKYVLYRYGPPFNADGSYGTGSFIRRALIDLIAETPENPNCSDGTWTRIPASSPKGFFVCINPNEDLVEVQLATTAIETKQGASSWASSTDSRLGDRASYQASSIVYTRAPIDVAVSAAPASVTGGSGTINFTFNRLNSSITTSDFSTGGSAILGTDYTLSATSPITFTSNTFTLTATTSSVSTAKTIIITVGNQSASATINP